MKIVYIILIMIFPLLAVAEDVELNYSVPDFEEIERDVKDYKSHYFYPKLMERFHNGDTTMTPTELERLYYGFSFQEDYEPYRDVKYNRQAATALYTKDSHTQAECDTIIAKAKYVLSDFPFELRQMKLLAYAYSQKGDEENSLLWETRLRQILSVIISSGDGISPESAWYVISSIHPYDVIYCFGLTPTDYTFVEPMYDFIEVKDGPADGYYFNVSRILKEYYRKQ